MCNTAGGKGVQRRPVVDKEVAVLWLRLQVQDEGVGREEAAQDADVGFKRGHDQVAIEAHVPCTARARVRQRMPRSAVQQAVRWMRSTARLNSAHTAHSRPSDEGAGAGRAKSQRRFPHRTAEVAQDHEGVQGVHQRQGELAQDVVDVAAVLLFPSHAAFAAQRHELIGGVGLLLQSTAKS